MSARRDDPIIGGNTPFFSPSDWTLIAGPELRRGLRVEVRDKNGVMVDKSRDVQLWLAAKMWNKALDEPIPGIEHGPFMREFIASANSSLQALGSAPLLSIEEVKGWAEAFRAWSAAPPDAARGRGR